MTCEYLMELSTDGTSQRHDNLPYKVSSHLECQVPVRAVFVSDSLYGRCSAGQRELGSEVLC